ncbi:SDR family NAD(P)-dependent oxidoreductase [Dinoroseobacter sp. PD6]|uniref:SDR family oxidoreductase n=1 Tax=Dinoroseobacter sp. PD6 TaxID=3028384 RepID=UPI00237BE7EC|nr:SDR family oxidoreductase [Dinoroseobacter sp. PD6]MDD9716976.1 SDR family NAD(P)-dependent oxidoreductase [Dinoroseobacter sp. PD6]
MSGTILITGASGGIGAAVADRFLAEGWEVGLLARRAAALQEVRAGRANGHVLVADVADPEAVAAGFASFEAAVGRLDVLFNNAGIFVPAAMIDEVPLADWDRAVAVNLTGMFLAARAAFGQMRRQDPAGGRIINNGSISAHVPREGAVCYTATKHAITGLTKQLSLDGRALGIACGQIDIGNARTELLEGIDAAGRARGEPPVPMIETDLVVDAVWQMAGLPLEANVQFMTLMATKMPYIGRG